MELEVDGRKIFAATGGRPFDPAEPAVVFLHGSGGDHTIWAMQTRYFAWHGYGVLAVDLPGHRRSDGPALTSIGDLADWVARLVEASGAGKAALVGHSLGALVALEAAARHSARISAIALLGVVETMRVHPDLLAASRADDHLAFELITAWGHARRSHRGGHRAPGIWMMGGATRLLERSRSGVLGADLAACDDYRGAAKAAAKVACPALFLLGADDRMTPPAGARPLAAAIAGSRTIIVPQAGHFMMIEQLDCTLDALRDFL